MLNLPQLTHVETSDPRLADSLRRIVDAVNTLGVGTGVDPAGATQAPTPIATLNVIAANGIFDIALDGQFAHHARHFLFHRIGHHAGI